MTVLPFGLTLEALADADAEADPSSLAAATRLRQTYGPALAAAALQQTALRRRALTKFGDAAAHLFFTRTGLEQATRPEVADLHAARFVAAGAHRVVDLGCGIGSDSMAFLQAGLDVVAVDLDPETVEVARANLESEAERVGRPEGVVVRCADAADVLAQDLRPGDAVFADPARRDERGRLWRVSDFTPDLGLLVAAMGGGRPVGVKLGPALPHSLVPEGVEAEWVSHRGDVVEAAVWSGPAATPGQWSALLWDADVPGRGHRLVAEPVTLPVRPAQPGDWLHEPDGAVIRSGAVGVLGAVLDAGLIDPQIAYLVGDAPASTVFADSFRVRELLAYDLKVLRRWVREHDVGTVEIKKRGVQLDPAQLRRTLKPTGSQDATLVVSRTPGSAIVLVVERIERDRPV